MLATPTLSLARRFRALLAAAILAGAIGVLTAATPPTASATTGCMCPASCSGWVTIGPYPDRCVHTYHSSYTWVSNYYNGTINKCAVVKPNSDGSGGDVGTSAVCVGGYQTQAIWRVANPGVPGYGTNINHDSFTGTFFSGDLAYYP